MSLDYEIRETDTSFRDSPDAGDPGCICSRCTKVIDKDPVRCMDAYRSQREYRFHRECVGLEPNTTATGDTPMVEFQNAAIAGLYESPMNTRRHFDPTAMAELTESVRTKGVLVPLLVREKLAKGKAFEILAGARRYRAAKAAGLEHVPVRICQLNDDEALEVLVIENLQRADIHPLEEAEGYRALLDRPGQDVDAIAAKVGKSASYIYQRLKLTELIKPAKQVFLSDEITAGHAILIARLQPKDQADALKHTIVTQWNQHAGKNVKRTVSVRELSAWIDSEVHLDLHSAPFKKDDATLLAAAGACTQCPKRTGFSPALFPDITKKDTCTDRTCFHAKQQAHLAQLKAILEAKGERVVEISTDYHTQKGGPLGSDKWNDAAAKGKNACASSQKAIVTAGPRDLGQIKTVCTDAKCPTHGRERHYGESPAAAAARKTRERREAEKQRQKTELARRTLDAVRAALPAKPERSDVERIVAGYIAEMHQEIVKRVAQIFAIEVPKEKGAYSYEHKDYPKHVIKWACALSDAELNRFLMTLPLVRALETDEWAEQHAGKALAAAAKAHKVSVAKIEKAVAAEAAERAAKRKQQARKATGTKPKTTRRTNSAREMLPPDDDVVDEDIRWLTCCPASDVNFKLALKRANAPTLERAIADLVEMADDGEAGTKSKLKPIEARLRALRGANTDAGLAHLCESCGCGELTPCPLGCAWDLGFRKKQRWVCTTPACVTAAKRGSGSGFQSSATA